MKNRIYKGDLVQVVTKNPYDFNVDPESHHYLDLHGGKTGQVVDVYYNGSEKLLVDVLLDGTTYIGIFYESEVEHVTT